MGAAVAGCLLLAMTVSAGTDLAALAKPPEGWVVQEPPRTAEGNQLFTVINGGAELYVRLGFARAVFASYQSPAGKSINLEIYQMKAPASAREVYDQKAGSEGRAADFGEASRLADHYLNFYKGPYQVTISGYDTDSLTINGIKDLASVVEERLTTP